jgi:hypothetical protein
MGNILDLECCANWFVESYDLQSDSRLEAGWRIVPRNRSKSVHKGVAKKREDKA